MSYEKDQFGEASVSISTMITTRLATYITSASVATALSPYITSASVATALAPYITSASVGTALAPYITSASVVTALAPYITSASVATALTPYLTSASAATALVTGTFTVNGTASFSGTVVMTTALQVNGTASFSGTVVATTDVRVGKSLFVSLTASVGAVTVAGVAWGRPGVERLGTATTAGLAGVIKVSGTWTNFHTLDILYQGKGAATTTNLILLLYTDGGTTPFLTYNLAAVTSATASDIIGHITVYNSNISAPKLAVPRLQYFAGVTTQATQTNSATLTTAAVNCIGICTGTAGVTTTQSAANVYVYGYRT